jgi:hypothetical protein
VLCQDERLAICCLYRGAGDRRRQHAGLDAHRFAAAGPAHGFGRPWRATSRRSHHTDLYNRRRRQHDAELTR